MEIPDDIRKAAQIATVAIFEGSYLSRSVQGRVEDIVSAAIMAAKAEERQDCEDVALRHAAAYDDSANGLPVDSYKVPYRLHRRNAANDIAAAIHKRGEA